MPFTPWTTREGYLELLQLLADKNLIEQVAPIQLAIRLLIPSGSKLLELPEIQQVIHGFDEASLCYQWDHEDSDLDKLSNQIRHLIRRSEVQSIDRRQIFNAIWQLSNQSKVERESNYPGSQLAPTPCRYSPSQRSLVLLCRTQ